MDSLAIMDEAPVSKFHKKLLLACCGGPFLDGYVLSIIGIALIGIKADFNLGSVEVGLIGAASLVGILFGATIFGNLTDRIGREKMYALDLTVLVAACFLSTFIQLGWQLIILRFILGLAIGADYPIATSLLTEFTPTKKRGYMIGMAAFSWSLGAGFAYVVGTTVVVSTGGYGAWRWLLLSSAILGVIVVALRRGIPESPRWLLLKGRVAEAEKVVEAVYGRKLNLSTQTSVNKQEEMTGRAAFKAIVSGGYLKRTIMCGTLYLTQITPQYALLTFSPLILAGFGIADGPLGLVGELTITILFAVGCLPAMKLVETKGRRPMTVIPFALMLLPLVALWLFPNGPLWFVIFAFCFYAFTSGGPNITEWIYPNELFPTEIRATAVGVSVGISRIGAATGVYLLPISLEQLGTGTTMMFGAILTLVGLLVCYAWAPETKGRSLEDTSGLPVTEAERGKAPALMASNAPQG
ncbi:MFS transporter [Paenarthrobacter sp. PH39-S1]|uniref:MFS transporter n=1 Tax=Paenarthrobacter sp. PH39-S1 TaxID=3046204 RepID=UPI0024BA4ACD|nr:MFS transporter [Paenarthrobacter sp. PH39-S1]MDJ0357085.1 MFS transporter [Paenarthrobacter sp. PH39-S1]